MTVKKQESKLTQLQHYILHDDLNPKTKHEWMKKYGSRFYTFNGVKSSLSNIFISLGVTLLFATTTKDPALRRLGMTSIDAAILSIAVGILIIWIIDRARAHYEIRREEEHQIETEILRNTIKTQNLKLDTQENQIQELANKVAGIKTTKMLDQLIHDKLIEELNDMGCNNNPSSDADTNMDINTIKQKTKEQFIKDLTE